MHMICNILICLLQNRFDPATARGTQRAETNEKRRATMLQHHEIKRLQTQLAEMPQAATAAAMADLQKQLDFARSKASDRKGALRDKNLTIKALQIQVAKQVSADLVLVGSASKLQAQLDDSQAQLTDAHSDQIRLEQQNSKLQTKLQDANKHVEELKCRSKAHREQGKVLRRQRQRDGSKWDKQVADFECNYKAMLIRKQRDSQGLMSEISSLIKTTSEACGRSQAETSRVDTALAEVQGELARRELELAVGREPIQTKKNAKEFDDNIVLLTMELMTLGVSENIVGQVESLCSRHLAKRELQQVVSKSSARRWGLQLPEVTIHHMGELVAQNAERGFSMSTDTTTIRQAERAANVYEVRLEDGSIRKLRGPVNHLASHTAHSGGADATQCPPCAE